MKNIQKNVGDIIITIDYKSELLGIIMCISNYKEKYKRLFKDYENKFYIERIINKFSKYKDEEIIKIFEDLVDAHSFNYDAPFALFLELDETFNSNQLSNYVFNKRLSCDKKVYNFLSKLNDFAIKINFEEYYKKNEKEYQIYIDSISNIFNKFNVSDFLFNYYGYGEDKEFIINLTPFITDSATSIFYDNKIYCCMPVYEWGKKENLYDCEEREMYAIKNPVHEFSHGYINPLTDKYNIIKENSDIFNNIKENMKKSAYPRNSSILNEHIIRAIVARFIIINIKDIDYYNNQIKKQIELGFIYINIIIENLIFYENNREKFKTFDLFYPTLVMNLISSIEKNKF